MPPWLLASVRKDDLATRYKRAEQSLLATELEKNPTPAGMDANELMLPAGVRQQARSRLIRWFAQVRPIQRHAIFQRILDSIG